MHNVLLLLMLLVPAFPLRAQSIHPRATAGSDTVFVRGEVNVPLLLTAGTIGGLQLAEQPLDGLQVTNEKGEVKKKLSARRGILLHQIVGKASPAIDKHKEQGRYVVVVTATDGYAVTFAYNELLHGQAGAATYLLLPDTNDRADGPFALFCGSDQVTVARYVKWVRSIEIRKI